MAFPCNVLYHTRALSNLSSSLVSLVLPITLIIQTSDLCFFPLASDPYPFLHCKQPKLYCLTPSSTVLSLSLGNSIAEPDFTPAFLRWSASAHSCTGGACNQIWSNLLMTWFCFYFPNKWIHSQCSSADVLIRVSWAEQSWIKSLLKENSHLYSDIPLHMVTFLRGFHPDLARRLILLW